MSGTPKSVKALREFYKDRLKVVDSASMLAEVMGESDRALVILIGTFLDDALIVAIAKRLPNVKSKSDTDAIFDYTAPLGSFSDRIKVAYALGVITKSMHSQLNDIREMRNACAHSKHSITFQTPELAAVCHRILAPTGTFPIPANPANLRKIFFTECAIIYDALLSGSYEQSQKKVMSLLKLDQGVA